MEEVTPTVSTSVIGWVVAGLASISTTLLSIVWKKQQSEIQDLKAAVGTKVSAETFETNRSEVREGIIDLHRKIEATDQRAQHRHDEVMRILLERK